MLSAVGHRASTSASTRRPPGTTRSPRSCWRWHPRPDRRRERSATTSTCATSRAAARCCSARRRTTTPRAAVGPFIRLFDARLHLDDVRASVVSLTVDGEDGFHARRRELDGADQPRPADLVGQAIGAHHQYPDGFVLFLGTMFAPIEDRDEPGRGFTHKLGDVVRIAEARLGSLVNRVRARRAKPSRGPSASTPCTATSPLAACSTEPIGDFTVLTSTDPRTGRGPADRYRRDGCGRRRDHGRRCEHSLRRDTLEHPGVAGGPARRDRGRSRVAP